MRIRISHVANVIVTYETIVSNEQVALLNDIDTQNFQENSWIQDETY